MAKEEDQKERLAQNKANQKAQDEWTDLSDVEKTRGPKAAAKAEKAEAKAEKAEAKAEKEEAAPKVVTVSKSGTMGTTALKKDKKA